MFNRLFAAVLLTGAAAPALAAQSAAPAQAGDTSVRTEVQKNVDASFGRFDSDSNGSLSMAELDAAQAQAREQASAALGKRIEAEFARLDTNKDGRLTVAEFKAGAPAPRVADSSATLLQLDSNRDGKLSAAEFRAPILAQFDRLDANRDGKLTPDERSRAQAAQARR